MACNTLYMARIVLLSRLCLVIQPLHWYGIEIRYVL